MYLRGTKYLKIHSLVEKNQGVHIENKGCDTEGRTEIIVEEADEWWARLEILVE